MKKSFRTVFRNLYKFERLFWTKKSFLVPLYKLYKEMGIPPKDKFLGGFTRCKTVKEIDEKNKIALVQRIEYSDKVGKRRTIEISDRVTKILEDNDLGQEWLPTLLDYLISGWLCPPMFNLKIYKKGINEKKRVILELNPDTSLDDIEEAWYVIKKMQRKSWPNFKKQKTPNIKAFENLRLYKRSIDLKLKGKKGMKMIWALFPEPGYTATNEEKIKDKRRQQRLKTMIHRLKG